MEETLILLRFNCPDPECDYIANGWSDLRLHVRGMHGKLMWYVVIYLQAILPAYLTSTQRLMYSTQESLFP
jgi:hypothetical protein